jgi:hypothetical protein
MSQGKQILWVKKQGSTYILMFSLFDLQIKKLIKVQQLFSWKNANANPLASLRTKFNQCNYGKEKVFNFYRE